MKMVRKSRRMMLCLFVIVNVLGSAQEQKQKATSRSNPRDVDEHYRNADAHRDTAMKYIQKATQQNRPDNLEKAEIEFGRASEEYLAYAALASNGTEHQRIAWAAFGLLRSYNAPAALQLILAHPGVEEREPEILHLKADALLALGSGMEAASTYERWIAQGKCISLMYRNWPGERKGGHPNLVFMPKGIHDACSGLPPELRARLETLQRLYHHPNNLPKKNYPTVPIDTN